MPGLAAGVRCLHLCCRMRIILFLAFQNFLVHIGKKRFSTTDVRGILANTGFSYREPPERSPL